MRIGWKVSTLDSNMASVRYRAVLPMLALHDVGLQNEIFASVLEESVADLDALVIVKSFTPDDFRLAQLACARGVPFVLDLCDNIFIDGYGSKAGGVSPDQMFLAMAGLASCVVTTTEPLAEAIRAYVPGVRVVVIPDGIETATLGARVLHVLSDAVALEKSRRMQMLGQRARNVARRVRVEGVQVIPSLMAFVARRGSRVLRRSVQRGFHKGINRVRARRAGLILTAAPERASARKIVWFGNHGAEHARFGMLDILEFRDALEAIAAEYDVELVVISNNRKKYEAGIAPLAIPSRYVEWTARKVDTWLSQATAVIVPNTLDAFSLCKSANRTVLALAKGAPVVATPTPALDVLADFIHVDDPLQALRQILAAPEQARARAHEAYRRAEALFGQQALGARWSQLLRELPPPAAATAIQPWLAVVLHLVQDLDLALPIMIEAQEAGLTCEAWCSAAIFRKSPRVFATLRQQGIPLRVLPDERALAGFQFPDAMRVLLTVAETNLGPHRVPRILSELAKRKGLLVATLQHGFENVGLTYDDALQKLDKVRIAAQRIYTWGPAQTLHPRISPAVRARCVPVGCPKEARVPAADIAGLLPAGRAVVGIFENLHWHRYTDAYREAFLANVASLAQAFTDVVFLVKPHHAGLWLTHRYEGEQPVAPNLVIADPQQSPWERHTASALLPHLAAVITSPSTVALDAARLDLPVAVVASGLALDNYRPLTLLSGGSEWHAFVAQALDTEGRGALEQRSTQFVQAVLIPGNAARRIVEDLRATVGA